MLLLSGVCFTLSVLSAPSATLVSQETKWWESNMSTGKRRIPQAGKRREALLLEVAVSRPCSLLEFPIFRQDQGDPLTQLPQDQGCQAGIAFPCVADKPQASWLR